MPKRKRHPRPDVSQRAVALVNAATNSEPVKGEDLLPARLRKEYREAKRRVAK
jgi:hypothetical protein